ncbi:MAG: hypothetical protein ACYC4L_13895 [Chloroflexota bacterium]
MADVFRGKVSGVKPALYPAYAFHGVTAVLVLWLVAQALAA